MGFETNKHHWGGKLHYLIGGFKHLFSIIYDIWDNPSH